MTMQTRKELSLKKANGNFSQPMWQGLRDEVGKQVRLRIPNSMQEAVTTDSLEQKSRQDVLSSFVQFCC